MKWLSAFLLKIWGWKIIGPDPTIHPKSIFAVAPHTSTKDFPLGILVRSAMGLKIKFIAKASLFKPPFGFIFRWLGGIPVDRSKRTNLVDAIVDIYNNHEKLSISIAPEGTRKKVDRLKTGFYYIAKGAKIPIILTRFDAKHKTVEFSKPFYTSDDKSKDLQTVWEYFQGVKGFNPELGIS